MYWFRTKTILIILFFCINIFLLVNMIISTNKAIVVDNSTIDNTLRVLYKNKILVDKDLLPKKIQNHPIKLQVELISMDSIAERIFSASGYTKSKESDNEYKYIYNNEELTIEGSYFDYSRRINNNAIESEDVAKKYIIQFIKNLGINTENIYFDIINNTDNGYFISCNYLYKENEIFGPNIIAEIGDNIHIYGYAVNPVGASAEKVPVIHITGVLIKFLGDEKINEPENIRISDISLGYRIDEENLKNELKELKVAPVWKIITDSNNIYYYKALK